MSWAWQFPPLPLGLEVRTSTLLMSAVVFGLAAWRTRSPWRGFVVLAAWISAYELLHVGTKVVLGRWPVIYLIGTTGMLGWVLLALWMGHRPSWPWLLVFTLSWAAWIAAGFHANLRHDPTFDPLQEAFNVVTKTALGLAYAFGSMPGTPQSAPRRGQLDVVISKEASPFDALAADYDRLEAENPIRQLMRSRSLAVLEKAFPPASALLDVGCGTGTEAIWLAQRGHRLTAVDSSPDMLDVLCRRAQVAGVKIATCRMSASELRTLADIDGDAIFDGAYSSFGALNTEPALEPPLAALARLVRPGGKVVLSVMNRWCVSEMALMVAGGRPKQAFRRYRPNLTVGMRSSSVEVRYPSWPELRRALGQQQFRVMRVEALLPLLLPYAWPAVARHASSYSMVARLDAAIAQHRPFSWLGDHLLVVAERRHDR
jgi:SAM-dependent methyltransferase